ncbi:MAG TPA: branched-chain amino acid ABC transporter permease [Candidatus Latescibacteria bacterium]|nr:branched-chain amino acid ABC transporter permease [Candidatus Latescibacterota bacterium]
MIQASLSGVAIGCVYSLVALGFVLIYKATGVLNFAQGELMMVGAYIYFSLVTSLDMTPLLAFGATLVLAGLLGALVERLVLHPLVDEPPFTLVMVTIGLATLLRAVTGMIWSHDTFAFPSPVPEGAVHVGQVAVPLVDVWTMAVTVVLSLLLFLFFHYTRLGTAMRAVAQNRYAAQLMGISVDRIFTLTWALAASLGAIGGMLLADISFLHTNMGFIGLRAFPAVVLGGMESIPGALLGGLIIGLIESLAGVYLDPILGGGTHQVLAFVILLVVLMLRPTGLFGATLEKRV